MLYPRKQKHAFQCRTLDKIRSENLYDRDVLFLPIQKFEFLLIHATSEAEVSDQAYHTLTGLLLALTADISIMVNAKYHRRVSDANTTGATLFSESGNNKIHPGHYAAAGFAILSALWRLWLPI